METQVRSVAPWRMHLFCDQQNTLLYIQQNKNKVTPEIQEKARKVADPIGNSGFLGAEAEIGWRNFSCIYFSSDNEKLFECHHTTKRLPSWLSSKESVYQCRRCRFDPWLGRSPGEGKGNSLQYSCWGNPTDREDWQGTVHGISKSQTQLSN